MSGANNTNSQQQPMAVIKRPQHNIKLANVLHNMLQCGSLLDVTIYCDDGQLSAHKLVLAASSTYFRNLFSRMTNAFHYPIIVLREMSINDLKTIIQFIYHGEVHVPQNRVDSLMRCANYLQIDGMASSANSLTAVLASSSAMPHHAILTAHSTGPLSASTTANLNNNSTTTSTTTTTSSANTTASNKLHTQYPPSTNCHKQSSRGHSSRSNHSSSNQNNSSASTHSTTNNSADNGNTGTSSSGKPKHTCEICLKTFTHGFTLKRHMKLHSQSRLTIYCDVCSKSYSCKDSYLRHKKSSGHLQHAEFHHRTIDMNLSSGR